MFELFYWCLEGVVSMTQSSKLNHKTRYNSILKKKKYF